MTGKILQFNTADRLLLDLQGQNDKLRQKAIIRFRTSALADGIMREDVPRALLDLICSRLKYGGSRLSASAALFKIAEKKRSLPTDVMERLYSKFSERGIKLSRLSARIFHALDANEKARAAGLLRDTLLSDDPKRAAVAADIALSAFSGPRSRLKLYDLTDPSNQSWVRNLLPALGYALGDKEIRAQMENPRYVMAMIDGIFARMVRRSEFHVEAMEAISMAYRGGLNIGKPE